MFKPRGIGSAVLVLVFSLFFLVGTAYSDDRDLLMTDRYEEVHTVETRSPEFSETSIDTTSAYSVKPSGADDFVNLDPSDPADLLAIEHYFYDDAGEIFGPDTSVPSPLFDEDVFEIGTGNLKIESADLSGRDLYLDDILNEDAIDLSGRDVFYDNLLKDD